ncbi:MAG: flavoprotein, partial [Streptosporangiaceae bacterium]
MTPRPRLLAVIVCGAGPASEVGPLIKLAQGRGWTVQVIATPAALAFIDVPAIEAIQTGAPVRSQYRTPGEPRSRPSDALIVAPATYNTICKWAQGISDTYALGNLAETTGLGMPVVVLPFVNTALAARAPFRRSVEELRRCQSPRTVETSIVGVVDARGGVLVRRAPGRGQAQPARSSCPR